MTGTWGGGELLCWLEECGIMANGYGISFQGDENVLELVVHKVVNIPQIADEFYYM